MPRIGSRVDLTWNPLNFLNVYINISIKFEKFGAMIFSNILSRSLLSSVCVSHSVVYNSLQAQGIKLAQEGDDKCEYRHFRNQ